MSEFINNASKRKEALKEIIRKLHQGRTVESLREEFGEVIAHATGSDIAEAEREVIAEGVPVSEIQKLCDLHVAVFQAGLESQPAPESLPGHPLFTFRLENEVIGRVLEALEDLVEGMQAKGSLDTAALQRALKNLSVVVSHYENKENNLFPLLEKHGFEGPSKVMWGVHNEIRKEIKDLNVMLEQSGPDLDDVEDMLTDLTRKIRDMIYKEEKVLIPEALNRLSPEEWEIIRAENEAEAARNKAQEVPAEPEPAAPVPADARASGQVSLSTGALTPEQINLMLTSLPVDITFVDENDEVRFFSQTKDRVFKRTAAIIGRKVQNCHPPQSVHVVQTIVDDFKTGKRDVAEFWIQMGPSFVHIRYFALRDAEGNYRGTIEVSQDVTGIRALEGERRLLAEEK